jgi:hypothetical protein
MLSVFVALITPNKYVVYIYGSVKKILEVLRGVAYHRGGCGRGFILWCARIKKIEVRGMGVIMKVGLLYTPWSSACSYGI